jgi:hypothetical protein
MAPRSFHDIYKFVLVSHWYVALETDKNRPVFGMDCFTNRFANSFERDTSAKRVSVRDNWTLGRPPDIDFDATCIL